MLWGVMWPPNPKTKMIHLNPANFSADKLVAGRLPAPPGGVGLGAPRSLSARASSWVSQLENASWECSVGPFPSPLRATTRRSFAETRSSGEVSSGLEPGAVFS